MTWHIVTHTSPTTLDAGHWNALLAGSGHPTPFMRHEWLQALHDHGCAVPDTGWTPLFLAAHRNPTDAPEAVCPLYLKAHSYGEYVFDWAWADAHQRAGLPYYPKLLVSSPFTPVPGARLLASGDDARAALLAGIVACAERTGSSSAHVLFPAGDDEAAARRAGWLMRQGVQFHWSNRDEAEASAPASAEPYADFADFLGSLQRDKRKKIQQERRRVREAGVTVVAREAGHIQAQDWDFFFECYQRTYRAHGAPPYLNRAFFHDVGQRLSEHWLMFTAQIGGEPVAASLIGIDRATGVAYGRYWGALARVDCLHFELCYYAPLAWCIQEGFRRFEGGAQGEHKMSRGLMPTPTRSAHWLRDERFADAVARYLARECAGVEAYLDELNDRAPFKQVAVNEPQGDAAPPRGHSSRS